MGVTRAVRAAGSSHQAAQVEVFPVPETVDLTGRAVEAAGLHDHVLEKVHGSSERCVRVCVLGDVGVLVEI